MPYLKFAFISFIIALSLFVLSHIPCFLVCLFVAYTLCHFLNDERRQPSRDQISVTNHMIGRRNQQQPFVITPFYTWKRGSIFTSHTNQGESSVKFNLNPYTLGISLNS